MLTVFEAMSLMYNNCSTGTYSALKRQVDRSVVRIITPITPFLSLSLAILSYKYEAPAMPCILQFLFFSHALYAQKILWLSLFLELRG